MGERTGPASRSAARRRRDRGVRLVDAATAGTTAVALAATGVVTVVVAGPLTGSRMQANDRPSGPGSTGPLSTGAGATPTATPRGSGLVPPSLTPTGATTSHRTSTGTPAPGHSRSSGVTSPRATKPAATTSSRTSRPSQSPAPTNEPTNAPPPTPQPSIPSPTSHPHPTPTGGS